MLDADDDFADIFDGFSDCAPRTATDNRAVALDLCRRGFAVMPVIQCSDGEWRPLKGWTDFDNFAEIQVARWWKQHPDARVALVCGARSGVSVLDVDAKNGKDGVATLRDRGFPDLEAMSPVRTRTPSGGWHVFFRYDPRLKNWVGDRKGVGTAVDVRTEGGWVIAPGSAKGDAVYEIVGTPLGSVDLPPFPEALIPPAEPERVGVDIVTNATGDQRKWAADRLAAWTIDVAAAAEGNRQSTLNDAVFWAAGAAAHGFVDEEQARAALVPAAEKCGLGAREIRATFKASWAGGLKKPIADFPVETDADEFDDLDDIAPTDRVAAGDDEEIADTESYRALMAKMCKRHALVIVGGKALVTKSDKAGGWHLWGMDAFNRFYDDVGLEVVNRQTKRPKWRTAADLWRAYPGKTKYPDGIVFAPEGAPKGALNLWRGWAVEPDAGASCSLFLAHLRDVICGGDRALDAYVRGWLAHMTQHPGDKPGVAIVMRGQKGTGKDVVGRYLARMIGARHVLNVVQQDHLFGAFNAELQGALLVHAEEAFWAGSKANESNLKNMITAPTMMFQPKGVDKYQGRSSARFLMSSNESWVVPASSDERRFAVCDVSSSRRGDADYFEKLHAEMDGEGPAALLHYLRDYDLTGFNVRRAPETAALQDQKLATLRNVEGWWLDRLHGGSLPTGDFDADHDWADAPQSIGRDELRDLYATWMRGQRFAGDIVDQRQFGRRLREMLPQLEDKRPSVKAGGSARARRYILPKLDECRAAFEAWMGGPVAWDGAD